ncbi:MAG: SCP-like extracellular [Candidatus Electrothrix sp. AUS4]|nr:SCP-like extracellular [Candidatus Electrothrix sp. AUS4]
MKTVRHGHFLWVTLGLLALLGTNGCVKTANTTNATSSVKAGDFFDPSELTAAHNKWRAEVGVPGLHWSDSLSQSAKAWANTLKGSCTIQHSMSQQYGENIYYAGPVTKVSSSGKIENSPQQVSSETVVDTWGAEKKCYDEKSNACHGGECGHYTQVVWKDTTEVGCGMAFCPDHAQIWVCQYKAAGNMRGKRPY